MSVETRKGRFYLYDRQRIGDRLRGTYKGALTAEEAQVIRQLEQGKREKLANEKRAVHAIDAGAASVIAAGAEFDQVANDIFRVGMHLMGYHLHNRGDWRRQRGVKPVSIMQDLIGTCGPKKPRPALVRFAAESEEDRALIALAAKGDQKAIPVILERLKDPGWLEPLGSVVKMARNSLVSQAAGDDLLVQEAVKLKLDQNIADLLASEPEPVPFPVRITAIRVAHCCLTVHILETILGRQPAGSAGAFAVERQLGSAERRLAIAQKCLATLRRLKRPAITQVNMANGTMQVNNAGANSAANNLPVVSVDK